MSASPGLLDRLIADSRRHLTAVESEALRALSGPLPDAERFVQYIRDHPDESSYHVLLALRRAGPPEYARIPDAVKAAVLTAALARLIYLNDWGYLDPREPYDGEAAQALLEVGAAAAPLLAPLLDDARPAPLFGSETATMSSMYGYRRSDFAYRYLAKILGLAPGFDADPRRRDPDIAALKRRLETT